MNQKKYRILVVDDENDLHDLFRKRFRELIKQGTLIFEFANNGKEALELISVSEPYQIVFTDIKMPVMDGLTFLNHLKIMKSEMKAVVISAYDDIINIRTAMNLDAFDFLVKPIVLDDLTVTLEKAIREYNIFKQGIEATKKLVVATREKEEAVHKERQRLSRDLHDDIGSTLSSISIISNTMLRSNSFLKDEKLKLFIEKISQRCQRLLDSMNDIVWSINPENDSMKEVLARMRHFAAGVLEEKNIHYEMKFPDNSIDFTFPLDIKNNLYLIFKESVNNLSKYSQCSHATLSFSFDENIIQLKIEDNGIGFNKDDLKHCGGLHNMQHRAEEINGTIRISSVKGQGTSIEVLVAV